MADKNFSAVALRLEPHLPQCPTQVITNHIRDAAIKACERTLAYRYEVPKYLLLPGVYEYAFEVPGNTEVHAIFGFNVDNTPLCPLTLDDAIRHFPEWAELYSGEAPEILWSETPGGYLGAPEYNAAVFNAGSNFVLPDAVVAEGSMPQVYCMVNPQRYIVLPLPDEGPYYARQWLALKPTRSATAMDSTALEELEDVIVHKALEDLLVMAGTPWYNPDLAGVHNRKYTYQTNERRARANIGHARGSMSVRMRDW